MRPLGIVHLDGIRPAAGCKASRRGDAKTFAPGPGPGAAAALRPVVRPRDPDRPTGPATYAGIADSAGRCASARASMRRPLPATARGSSITGDLRVAKGGRTPPTFSTLLERVGFPGDPATGRTGCRETAPITPPPRRSALRPLSRPMHPAAIVPPAAPRKPQLPSESDRSIAIMDRLKNTVHARFRSTPYPKSPSTPCQQYFR